MTTTHPQIIQIKGGKTFSIVLVNIVHDNEHPPNPAPSPNFGNLSLPLQFLLNTTFHPSGEFTFS